MNKKMVLMIFALLGASMQVDAMDASRRLKFVNKTMANLLIFTAQRPGSDPIIVGDESEVLTLNPQEKMYVSFPQGTHSLEIQDNTLVRVFLTADRRIVLESTPAHDVTMVIDKDGYAKFINNAQNDGN